MNARRRAGRSDAGGPTANSAGRPAGLARILAACVYDGVVTLAILFAATALALVPTGGKAIAPGNLLYDAYLLIASFAYFGWCWTRGRTLGMRAWRLRIEHRTGGPPGWRAATLRFVAALLSWVAAGLGFAWILVDPQRRSWHDRLSSTRLLVDDQP